MEIWLFLFMAYMDKVAMNVLEQVFYGYMFSFLSDKCLEVEFLSHWTSIYLTL